MSHRSKFSSSSTILAMDCFFKIDFPPLASNLESKCILNSPPSIFLFLYYNLDKVSLSRGGSYIDSPKWLKNKKATINSQNKKDGRFFQYAVTVALNHEQIKTHPERISKIKPFIGKYNWKEIDFPSQSKD